MQREYAEHLIGKTRQDYNRIADHFSRVRQKVWEEMRFLFDEYLIPGERVLDLGCGNGRFFSLFKGKDIDYCGVDSSEKLIEIAKKRNPGGRFQVADTFNLPFPNNFFNKIYSIAVLHHIPSQAFRLQFLKEAKRTLKPEGLLILTVWNLWQNYSRRKLIYKFGLLKLTGLSKLDFGDILIPWHNIPQCYFHCFTKKELEKLVKQAGFKIKESGEIIISQNTKPNSNFYIIAEK